MAIHTTRHVIQKRIATPNGDRWSYVTEGATEADAWASPLVDYLLNAPYPTSRSDLQAVEYACIVFEDGDVITATHVVYSADDDGIDREVGRRAVRGTVRVKNGHVSLDEPYIALTDRAINGVCSVLTDITVVTG